MSRQPEPVKQSDDVESESDKDESETEGGEEDTDDSDPDEEQEEEGVGDDNEEDDRDEQQDEDEEEDEDEENEDEEDEDEDDDDDVEPNGEVAGKHEPPSEAAKVLRGQQSKVNGAQQPAKEVKEKAEQAAKDVSKQGQQAADKAAKQAEETSKIPRSDLAGVSRNVNSAVPDKPISAKEQVNARAKETKNGVTQAGRQKDDNPQETKKDAKRAAGRTAEQTDKTPKSPESKEEVQDGDPFAGLQMTANFPKSTSGNDVWVNVTSTAESTSVTIRIPGK